MPISTESHCRGSACVFGMAHKYRKLVPPDLVLCYLQEDTKDQGWWFWPEPIRKRDPAAVAEATKRHEENINRFIAQQFLFDRQWKAVKVAFCLMCYSKTTLLQM